jgi:hypothetical protein
MIETDDSMYTELDKLVVHDPLELTLCKEPSYGGFNVSGRDPNVSMQSNVSLATQMEEAVINSGGLTLLSRVALLRILMLKR